MRLHLTGKHWVWCPCASVSVPVCTLMSTQRRARNQNCPWRGRKDPEEGRQLARPGSEGVANMDASL